MADTVDLIPRKRGRPAVIAINPELKQQLVDIIRRGNYVTTAMMALGLDDDFYYHCLRMADRGVAIYKEFVRELKRAEAEAEIDAVDKMRTLTNWIPHATFLERRHRNEWGRSEKKQIDSNITITVQTVNYNQLLKQMKK